MREGSSSADKTPSARTAAPTAITPTCIGTHTQGTVGGTIHCHWQHKWCCQYYGRGAVPLCYDPQSATAIEGVYQPKEAVTQKQGGRAAAVLAIGFTPIGDRSAAPAAAAADVGGRELEACPGPCSVRMPRPRPRPAATGDRARPSRRLASMIVCLDMCIKLGCGPASWKGSVDILNLKCRSARPFTPLTRFAGFAYLAAEVPLTLESDLATEDQLPLDARFHARTQLEATVVRAH